jgi:hypothetical protein
MKGLLKTLKKRDGVRLGAIYKRENFCKRETDQNTANLCGLQSQHLRIMRHIP